jgi:hypothetical protein
MTETERELYQRIMEAERESVLTHPALPPSAAEPPTVHYTELPESPAGKPGSVEWNFYRRVIGQLLADGHEGRWVLIKGEELVGVWDTEDEVNRARLARFLLQDVLMKQVREREQVVRGWQWRSRWH